MKKENTGVGSANEVLLIVRGMVFSVFPELWSRAPSGESGLKRLKLVRIYSEQYSSPLRPYSRTGS